MKRAFLVFCGVLLALGLGLYLWSGHALRNVSVRLFPLLPDVLDSEHFDVEKFEFSQVELLLPKGVIWKGLSGAVICGVNPFAPPAPADAANVQKVAPEERTFTFDSMSAELVALTYKRALLTVRGIEVFRAEPEPGHATLSEAKFEVGIGSINFEQPQGDTLAPFLKTICELPMKRNP